MPCWQMAWMILSVIGLHSMLEYPLWYGPFQLTVLLCLVLLWRRPADNRVQDSHSRQLKRPFRLIGQHFIALYSEHFCCMWGGTTAVSARFYLSPQDRSAAYAAKTPLPRFRTHGCSNHKSSLPNSPSHRSLRPMQHIICKLRWTCCTSHQNHGSLSDYSTVPWCCTAMTCWRFTCRAIAPHSQTAMPHGHKKLHHHKTPTFPRASPASEHP